MGPAMLQKYKSRMGLTVVSGVIQGSCRERRIAAAKAAATASGPSRSPSTSAAVKLAWRLTSMSAEMSVIGKGSRSSTDWSTESSKGGGGDKEQSVDIGL